MNIVVSETNEIFKLLDKKENNFFDEKKILLLGSDGFLGRYFVEYFNKLNNEKIKVFVDCVDNNISSNRIEKKKISKNFTFYKTNINKFNLKKKYDLIIFLAGIADPSIYKKLPLDALEVSYTGVSKFIKKAKNDKSTFIFFSSSEIYGNPSIKNIPTKESYYGNVNSYGPRACYDEGKRVGETLCYIYNTYLKTKTKIIRPFNIFGPGMGPDDGRVVPRFVRAIRSQKPMTIYNHGKQTRTFCYIVDAMIGFLKVIVSGKDGEIYNVGNNLEEISMNKLAKILTSLTQYKTIIKKINYPSSYPSNEPMRRCPDLHKIKKHTRYTPKIKLKDSLKRFLESYMND